MPGAGSSPAGSGPAGHDPVAQPSAPQLAEPPQAMLYDPATRDFPTLASGQIQQVHPVDQEIALRLTVRRGTIASNVAFGSGVRDIRYQKPSLEREVLDAVRLAIAPVTDRGDALLLGVTVERGPQGFAYEVRYRNLRTNADVTKSL